MELGQQAAEFQQHGVPGDLVIDFVDQVELVDVQVEHGVLRVSELRVAQCTSHLVEKGLTVDQPGQAVMIPGKTQGLLDVFKCLIQALVKNGQFICRCRRLDAAAKLACQLDRGQVIDFLPALNDENIPVLGLTHASCMRRFWPVLLR